MWLFPGADFIAWDWNEMTRLAISLVEHTHLPSLDREEGYSRSVRMLQWKGYEVNKAYLFVRPRVHFRSYSRE